MISSFHEVLDFNRLFLKLNQFTRKCGKFSPFDGGYNSTTEPSLEFMCHEHNIIQLHGCVSFYI